MKTMVNYAKGSWQLEIIKELATGLPIVNPISRLQGKARGYTDKYKGSWYNLLARLRSAGYIIEYTPGSRGGAWSSTYRIIQPN